MQENQICMKIVVMETVRTCIGECLPWWCICMYIMYIPYSRKFSGGKIFTNGSKNEIPG